MAQDFYRLLGVSRNAPEKEIKRAYHDLARKMHPDKADSAEEAERLQREFAAVTKAYNTLKDPEKRLEYDKKLGKAPDAAEGAGAPSTGSREPAKATRGDDGGGAAVDRQVEAGRQTIAERAYQRGMQFFNNADYARAIDFFETAVKNRPEEARYMARLAQSLMEARRGFTRAVEVATKACEIDPYNIEYKLTLAKIYEQAGSKSLAIRTYEDILKWDSENIEALTRLSDLRPSGGKSFFGGLLNAIKSKLGH